MPGKLESKPVQAEPSGESFGKANVEATLKADVLDTDKKLPISTTLSVDPEKGLVNDDEDDKKEEILDSPDVLALTGGRPFKGSNFEIQTDPNDPTKNKLTSKIPLKEVVAIILKSDGNFCCCCFDLNHCTL